MGKSQHFESIKAFNKYFHLPQPKKDLIDVIRYDESDDRLISFPNITYDFYLMAFKRNMTDPDWYGNTEYDPDSGFLYFVSPKQVHTCNVEQKWNGYHILISPILLQEHNISFNFFDYEFKEALFLTQTEQARIENLFEQIYDEYQKDDYSMSLLMAYCNLFLTYVEKCYQRQFHSREPLYNKLVVEFKKLLNSFYHNNPEKLPTVNYFAENLNLSSNYFSDLIKHHTQQTASEIIQEKIISEAKSALKKLDKSISEVGYELGFEYPTYFARMFKKHTGMTPSNYRQNVL